VTVPQLELGWMYFSFAFYTLASYAILLWKWYICGALVAGQNIRRRSLAVWWDSRLWMQI